MAHSINSEENTALVEGIQDLRTKVVTLFSRPFDKHMLGNVSLEIILRRWEIQKSLESSSTENKEKIKQMMETLNEFERAIISLYVMQRTSRSSNSRYELPRYHEQKYELPRYHEQKHEWERR